MYNPNENNRDNNLNENQVPVEQQENTEHTPKYAEGTQPIEPTVDQYNSTSEEFISPEVTADTYRGVANSAETESTDSTQEQTYNSDYSSTYNDGYYHGVPSAANQNYTESTTPMAQEQVSQPATQPAQPAVQQVQNQYGAQNATHGTYQEQSYNSNVDNTSSQYQYGTGYETSSNGTPTYTWTTQNEQSAQNIPQYTPHQGKAKKVKEKKPSKHIGVKVMAVLLCCLIASAATLGAFTLMIKNGVVAIDGGDNKNAAFTIHQVQKDTTSTTVGAAIGELTPQEVADKLIPSVVCIQVYTTTTPNNMFGGMFGGFDEYDVEDSFVSPTSEGSGIIYTKDGYVVTNAHVISGAEKIKVVTSDGLSYEAELIGADEATDLAVIKVANADVEFTPAEFGSSKDLQVADTVMAIGNPGGIELNSSVTIGYVSALNREITDSSGFTLSCIQTDAAINPGNSGGALVNLYGQVVGINSSKIVASGYEGLGFAIPSDTAQPIVTSLMENGYVKDRAVLGLSAQFIDSTTARFYGLTAGMYVGNVVTEEAMKSGLEEGDVITAIDGNPVTSSNTIKTYLVNKKPGETVELTVNRATEGRNLTLELVLSESNG